MYELISVISLGNGFWKWNISAPNGALISQARRTPGWNEAMVRKAAMKWCGDRNEQLKVDRRAVKSNPGPSQREGVDFRRRLRRMHHEHLKRIGRVPLDK